MMLMMMKVMVKMIVRLKKQKMAKVPPLRYGWRRWLYCPYQDHG